MARSAERFLCVSNAVREHYIREGLPEKRVLTIYNGIDTNAIRPAGKQPSGAVRIGWFGRLEKWKGAATLIDAAKIILGTHMQTQFSIVGAGPESESLGRMVEGDPITRGRVQLAGFRENAIDLLSQCDVLVNTSIEPEPLSRSALEALALGIPIVASKAGGNPEIVEDGTNGFLVEPGNPSRLAEALVRLIDDEGMRIRFGAESRRRAENIFNSERYVQEVEGVYSQILAKRDAR